MSNPDYPGMTNIAADFAAITEGDFLRRDNKKWELLKAADAAAAAEGKLAGRYLQEPFADGYAIYEICWIRGKRAYLRHVDVGDAWHATTLEDMAKAYEDPLNKCGILYAVDLAFAKKKVARLDALNALFAKKILSRKAP